MGSIEAAPASAFLSRSPGDSSAPGRSSPVAGAPPLRELLRTAAELVPELRRRAVETESQRCVPEWTMAAFRDAGFFRLMQPSAHGGFEYGFTALIDLISELARGCTSSAWNCAIAVSHQWLIAGFPAQAQADVWHKHRDAVACASYAPTGSAQRCEGGQLISGRWRFVSNVDHSEWAILGASLPPRERNLPVESAFLLVPRTDWTVDDDWHVAGQAGTGSKCIVIEAPVFVPEHRLLSVSAVASGRSPGSQHNRHPLYRMPMLSAFPVCLLSPLLGTAFGAIEQFVELCGSRVTRGGIEGAGSRLHEFYPVQSRIAEATALADAAQLLIQRDTAEVERAVMQEQSLTLDQRIRNRRDHAFAARLAREAVDVLFAAVGGEGLALSHPLQRMWRDANAIVRHITLNWDAVSAMVGQHLLGLVPKGQY